MRTFMGLGLAFAAIVLASGCEQQRSDLSVHKAVNDALNQSDGMKSVNVDVHNNVVVLKGEVASDELKARAETLARRNAPGYNVENRLVVNPSHSVTPARTTEKVRD